MREWIGSAPTEEKAVERGLKALGLSREQVDARVLEEKTSGLFSLFGFRRVRVKLTEKLGARGWRQDRPEDDRKDRGERGREGREFRDGGGRGRDRRNGERRDGGGRGPRDGFDDRGERNGDRGRPREDARRPRRDEPRFPRERGPENPRQERPSADREDRNRDRGNRPLRERFERQDRPPREPARPAPAAETREEAPRRPAIPPEELLTAWRDLLGWEDLSWDLQTREDGGIRAVLKTSRGQRLMDKGGRALDAFQYLFNLARARGDRQVPRVAFEVEGFAPPPRDDAEEAPPRPAADDGRIAAIARSAADEVRRTGVIYRLDPMENHERRLVHQALADDPDVETASEGEGPWRKVVVKPKKRG